MGATLGSYFGLFLLGAAFTAIGIFASAITPNQIIAFLTAIFLCFFIYIGFNFISKLELFYARIDDLVALLGMDAHYVSLSRGVVDSRDLLYFLSVIAFFLGTTHHLLEKEQ
jgi:ABC-2 type transport system permease protein